MINILIALIIGCSGALATKFILFLIGDPHEETVNPRAILSFIGVWIFYKYEETEKKIKDKIQNPHLTDKTKDKYLSTRLNWYKAAGACHYCLNVYVTAIVCTVGFINYDMSFWNLIFALPLSHFLLGHIID
jgi:hypothetical protein